MELTIGTACDYSWGYVMFNDIVIDVVIQATGNHANGVADGVAETLRRMGMLGRVFRPRAGWGAPEPENDDGLFDYLGLPNSHIMLFLGFDWHSQCLHTTTRWRRRLRSAPVIKVCYCHETLTNGSPEEQAEKTAVFTRAASVVDFVWHSGFNDHPRIVEIVGDEDRVFFRPFAVDIGRFRPRRTFAERAVTPFFRGKTTAFTERNEYQERRDYLQHLTERGLVEVKPYAPTAFDDDQLAAEYNQYRYCIDLPSVFDGPTTRVYEALASGCVVYSHRRNYSDEEVTFYRGHLRTFTSIDDLAAQLTLVTAADEEALVPHERWLEEIATLDRRMSLDAILTSIVERILAPGGHLRLPAPEVTVIDHAYHAKTNSQAFLLDPLVGRCNSRLYYDDMSSDRVRGYFPDGVGGVNVIWQCCHSDVVHRMCEEGSASFIFPMFDSSNHRQAAEFPAKAKYFCFSRTLHEKLRGYGLNSELCTYYPQPLPRDDLAFVRQAEKRRRGDTEVAAYFWFRIPPVDLALVSRFLKPLGITKLYVNLSPDPGVEVRPEDWPSSIEGVPIEYVGWMPRKRDLIDLLANCLVYFAPRVCEGIGLSFLEAMAQGMCVVAPNYPTMNEYIDHGRTGILYDIQGEPQIPATDVATLAENGHRSVEIGRAEWLRQERKIHDEIDPLRANRFLRSLADDHGVEFYKSYGLRCRLVPAGNR